MLMNRTYKYKIIPNKSQNIELNKIVGCCRFVYNIFLHFNIEQFKKHKKTIFVPDMLKMLEVLKTKNPFLYGIPSQILESTVITLKSDINSSIKNNKPFPSYRKKGQDDMFSLIKDFNIEESFISIPGIEKIKYINTRQILGKAKTVHILKKNNRWQVNLLVLKKSANVGEPAMKKTLGIDVGLKEFAILSSGHVVKNPQFYRKLEEKLRIEQRKLTRKVYKSKSWERQKFKVQQIHEKIYNSRMNFLHQLTHHIIQNYDIIGVEKLSIQTLSQNRRLSKSIMDASWGTFIQLLKYKAEEKAKVVIEVGRYFPSSQLCSNCASRQIMPLHLRTYICKNCSYKIDRDYNASKNIEKRALELYSKR